MAQGRMNRVPNEIRTNPCRNAKITPTKVTMFQHLVIYKAFCFDVLQSQMSGVPNETPTHSFKACKSRLLTIIPTKATMFQHIVIYKVFCFDVTQSRMSGAPNETRTHS